MRVPFKVLLFLLLFSVLHFGYDITHLPFLKPFCGVNESVFQHLKMVFWAYLLSNIVEYLLVKKRLSEGKDSFWYSRLFITVQLPWFIVLVWYLLPSILGRMTNTLVEVGWAVASSYVSALFGVVIERNIEKVKFNLAFKVVTGVLFIVSAFFYIWCTYHLPYIDLFIDPELLPK
ncbi:MAG: DUF6512 family protein [bacterium]|nr:DUF6512 family protein [bacterium]